MSQVLLIHRLEDAWMIFGVYWVGAAFLRKDRSTPNAGSKSFEARLYRPVRFAILALTFVLLFWNRTSVGFLGAQVVPPNQAVLLTGFCFALVGLAIAVWARINLGRFWSDKVALQNDHQLIRSGPYAYMRHPIYSGVLLGVLGSAVVVDAWRGVVAFAILITNYAIKAKREERVLQEQFGDAFQRHVKSTGFLLPRLHTRS